MAQGYRNHSSAVRAVAWIPVPALCYSVSLVKCENLQLTVISSPPLPFLLLPWQHPGRLGFIHQCTVGSTGVFTEVTENMPAACPLALRSPALFSSGVSSPLALRSPALFSSGVSSPLALRSPALFSSGVSVIMDEGY
ncbi:unnamed protein product [Gadus morhua 'NCC']